MEKDGICNVKIKKGDVCEKMNNKGETSASGGIGFFGLLQVCFIVLKVTGIINWSWIKVFLPTFIGGGLTVLLLIVCVIIALKS